MHGFVKSTAQLTPSLRRVVLAGGDLDGFAVPDAQPWGRPATDAYVNLAFRPEGAPYAEVFDPKPTGKEFPDAKPARRRYTVRAFDPATKELTIDFVVHGDVGVAGRWASHVEPGDVLNYEGPSGGYCPDPDADWHLLAGDESALPAIAASLESLTESTAPVLAFLVVDSPDHETPLATTPGLDLTWVHRPADLAAAVAAADFPAGRPHGFVHGEADETKAVLRHLLDVRGWERSTVSCSPYWRRTMTDESWRVVKRDFVQSMESGS